MSYDKDKNVETVLVGYYNVLFYLKFKKGEDDYKKDILLNRIDGGEEIRMKDICDWCKRHKVPWTTRFIYRKDFSIVANIWNLYSYCRFRVGT